VIAAVRETAGGWPGAKLSCTRKSASPAWNAAVPDGNLPPTKSAGVKGFDPTPVIAQGTLLGRVMSPFPRTMRTSMLAPSFGSSTTCGMPAR
jgi:hypothetical protein